VPLWLKESIGLSVVCVLIVYIVNITIPSMIDARTSDLKASNGKLGESVDHLKDDVKGINDRIDKVLNDALDHALGVSSKPGVRKTAEAEDIGATVVRLATDLHAHISQDRLEMLSALVSQKIHSAATGSQGWHAAGELVSYRSVAANFSTRPGLGSFSIDPAKDCLAPGVRDKSIKIIPTYIPNSPGRPGAVSVEFHDCQLQLEELAEKGLPLTNSSTDPMAGIHSIQGHILGLVNVQVFYNGGALPPVRGFGMVNCSLVFQLNSPPDTERGRRFINDLLAANDPGGTDITFAKS